MYLQDYNPESNLLSKKEKKAVASHGGDGVMLMSIRSDKAHTVTTRSSSSASAGSAPSPPT